MPFPPPDTAHLASPYWGTAPTVSLKLRAAMGGPRPHQQRLRVAAPPDRPAFSLGDPALDPRWLPCIHGYANAVSASRGAGGYVSLHASGCREHLPAAISAALAEHGIGFRARFPLTRTLLGRSLQRAAPVPAPTGSGYAAWEEQRGRMAWPPWWRGDWRREACPEYHMNVVAFERAGLRYVSVYAAGCPKHLPMILSREGKRLGLTVTLKL